MRNKLRAFRYRLMVAWLIMTSEKFIVNTRGSRTYIKNVNMNDAVRFHTELTTFLNTMIESANAQESAVKAAEDILNGKQ